MAKAKTAKRSSIPLPIEADERHQDQVDGFIARNRDALNDSIRRSRKEVEKDIYSTRSIDDIISDGRRRNKRSS